MNTVDRSKTEAGPRVQSRMRRQRLAVGANPRLTLPIEKPEPRTRRQRGATFHSKTPFFSASAAHTALRRIDFARWGLAALDPSPLHKLENRSGPVNAATLCVSVEYPHV